MRSPAMKIPMLSKSDLKRFKAFLKKRKNGCVEWTGSLLQGYGSFSLGRSMYRANRVAWFIRNGEIPEGLFACHRCNNRKCCNPKHLYLATHSQNLLDAGRDGLMPGAVSARGCSVKWKGAAACAHGHAFTPENTYRHKIMLKRRLSGWRRGCKTCRRRLTRQTKDRWMIARVNKLKLIGSGKWVAALKATRIS